MDQEDELSVFNNLEETKRNYAAIGFRVFCLAILFLGGIFFLVFGCYAFYQISIIQNIGQIYEGQGINPYTKPVLMFFLSGLCTLITGIVFLLLRKRNLAIILMLAGNIISYWLTIR